MEVLGLAPVYREKGKEMKIDNIGRLQNIQPTANESKGAEPSGKRPFKDLLAREIDAGPGRASATDQSPGIDPSKLDEMILHRSLSDPTGTDRQARESLEAGIGEMESLVHALGDRAIGPRAVERIVQDLPAKLEVMRGSIAELQADHPLRLIAEELSVLSHVESVKWRRGDYV